MGVCFFITKYIINIGTYFYYIIIFNIWSCLNRLIILILIIRFNIIKNILLYAFFSHVVNMLLIFEIHIFLKCNIATAITNTHNVYVQGMIDVIYAHNVQTGDVQVRM